MTGQVLCGTSPDDDQNFRRVFFEHGLDTRGSRNDVEATWSGELVQQDRQVASSALRQSQEEAAILIGNQDLAPHADHRARDRTFVLIDDAAANEIFCKEDRAGTLAASA